MFNFSFLQDHVLKGKPVVPFVCALDSAFRFTSAQTLRNVQLIKGIIDPLPDVSWVWKQDGKQLALYGNDVMHYKAEMSDTQFLPELFDLSFPRTRDDDLGFTEKPDYTALFHGPLLQTIDCFTSTERTATARLKSSRDMDWEKQDWIIDPAIADAGLQLAYLLAYKIMHKPSLPTKIEEVYAYPRTQPMSSPVYCRVNIHTFNKLGYKFDVDYFDTEPLYTFKNLHIYFIQAVT